MGCCIFFPLCLCNNKAAVKMAHWSWMLIMCPGRIHMKWEKKTKKHTCCGYNQSRLSHISCGSDIKYPVLNEEIAWIMNIVLTCSHTDGGESLVDSAVSQLSVLRAAQ